MGFKDYRKFSKRENQEPEVIQNNEEITKEEINDFEVTPIENVEDIELKAEVTTKGVVVANKLNIRKEASKEAEVLTVVSKDTSVGINLTKSTDEFYCVNVIFNSEITEGYAMKKFVEINN